MQNIYNGNEKLTILIVLIVEQMKQMMRRAIDSYRGALFVDYAATTLIPNLFFVTFSRMCRNQSLTGITRADMGMTSCCTGPHRDTG